MRIVLLGYPGAGKGTQSRALSAKYGIPHLASGDLLRAEIKAKTPLGLKVAGLLKKGTLVPDATVIEMIEAKLDRCADGFVLDGYPRTLGQAKALDQYLKRARRKLDLVFYLTLPREEVLRRLTSRRTCANCGALYNLVSRPPKADGRCDACGGPLVQRDDDKEGTVRKRLDVYEDLTRPLTAYYRSGGVFHEVDGSSLAPDVTARLAALADPLAVHS